MFKKTLSHCGIVAIIVAFSSHSYAQEQYRSHIPWKFKQLSSSKYGDWSESSNVYIADMDGNGSSDIIQHNPGSGENALKIFVSRATTDRMNSSHQESKFRSDIVDFSSHKLGHNFIWSFNGDHTALLFGQFDGNYGKDILRQETTAHFGHDEFNSAEIYKSFNNGDESDWEKVGISPSQGLPDSYNGYKGNELDLGDFNGDGLSDILLREEGDIAEDISYNVMVAFSGEDSNKGASVGGLSNLTMSSDSDGSDDEPGWLFPADKSHVRIGDFNGDGNDDILRWDSTSSMPDDLDDDHAKIDIWFGLGTTGQFKRSHIYLDADANYIKTGSDSRLNDSFTGYSRGQIRIGDFNGDGNDDILVVKDFEYTVYISHAVRTKEYANGNKEVKRSNIALFSQVKLKDEYTNLNDPARIAVADFNNDGRDDIALWNGLPYILYSTSGANGGETDEISNANFGDVKFVAIIHDKTIDGNGQGKISTHFSGHRITYKEMKVSDFTGDGYPDLLMIPSEDSGSDAYIYITPPYNPLTSLTQTTFNQAHHMQGLAHKEKQFVFFGEDSAIKYIFRDEAGWHPSQTLPLYYKTSDPRCDNDKPDDASFLQNSVYPDTMTEGDYLQPVCNAAYQGQPFDIVSDGQYIYLFRSYGQGSSAQVLVERFDFSEIDNNLIRLIESRFSENGKRYVNPGSDNIVENSNQEQQLADPGAISTRDKFNQLFFEPSFKVPYALDSSSPDAGCKVQSLTASVIDEANGGQRFVIASDTTPECNDSSNEFIVVNLRKGEEQIFATSNLSLVDKSNVEQANHWIYVYKLQGSALKLESMPMTTTTTGNVGQSNEKETTVDTELLVLSTYLDTSGKLKTQVSHLPFSPDGNLSDKRNIYHSSKIFDGTEPTTPPRLYGGTDGLVHMYWRGDNSMHPDRENILIQAVLDPKLLDSSGQLKTLWRKPEYDDSSNGITIDQFADSWSLPQVYEPYSAHVIFNFPANAIPKWTPKFGTYYNDNDATLRGHTTINDHAPIVFENARLIDKNGQKSGLLVREFVELHREANGQYRVAFSEVPLTELDVRLDSRVELDATPIGFIEGAPPVPRENLGRNQNGHWGYSTELSDVEILIEEGTTVSTEADNAGGVTAWGRLTLGADIGFMAHKLSFNTSLSAGAISGKYEDYTLSQVISRKVFITGSVPGRECTSEESPYLDTCYTEDNSGNKQVELWAPFNVGALFVSTVDVSRYSLHNPDNGKLLGYAFDFSDAAISEKSYEFAINPEYQVAGSLDGYIGSNKVLGAGNSYFNPKQERHWLLENARQEKELSDRFAATRTSSIDTTADDFIRDKLLKSGFAVTLGAISRTATAAAASITDYYGYEIGVDASVDYEFENPPTGAGFGVGVGGYYNRIFQQGQNTEKTLSFESNIDMGVTSEVQDEFGHTLPYAVDKYNARSYFLPASENHFQDFFELVVSPHLLSGNNMHPSEIITAELLRKIRRKSNKIWRVVHRVDGVSRYMPDPNP